MFIFISFRKSTFNLIRFNKLLTNNPKNTQIFKLNKPNSKIKNEITMQITKIGVNTKLLKNVITENFPKVYKIIGKIIIITENVSFKDLTTKPSLFFKKYGKIFIIPSTENALKYNPISKIIYGFINKMTKTVNKRSFNLSLTFP